MPLLRIPCLLLAILAVACAQVFGLQRGYLCERAGVVVETMADHHHIHNGLHIEHTGEDVHHHPDVPEDDTEHHAPLKVDFGASHVPVSLTVNVTLQWDYVPLQWGLHPVFSELKRLTTEPPEPGERPPPAALLVAQSVVILV